MSKVQPFDAYQCYLSIKRHFVDEKYDYFKYNGKSRANLQSFYKRKDRFWFEKIARQKTDQEILNFFVANFASCNDPETLWIGEIIKNGEISYVNWQRKLQSLKYNFTQEIKELLENHSFEILFNCTQGHPVLLKEYLKGKLSLETLVILEKVFSFVSQFDRKLNDPIWSVIRRKIQKYSSFIHIDETQYKKVLRDLILERE